jgi:hypothetical protein
MDLDKEVVSYKLSEMDLVKYKRVDIHMGNFRDRVLYNIETVDIFLRESEKILPIIKN